ncbi:transglutaminase [Thioclava sp. SK-1]|uniref:transglutaminase-like domain-containing protein n=1 Tax=Thioclava sp. SK-1 TaxID=1889770 RepID=UPI0008244CA3|nr:transglutaminase family protein [Thioclava sp. SK-1]OCX62287.1 transglutaminase [Thioclava sp. SK-1]
MRITVDVTMTYRFTAPNTVFLVIEAAHTEGQQIVSESLNLGDATVTRISGDSGVGERIWAQVPGQEMVLNYAATVDITRPNTTLSGLAADEFHQLPAEVVPYLRPSRYCQSDKFVAFVEKRFEDLEGGAKIDAMRNWIEEELSYVPGSSVADTTVLETFAGRQGVCRDYAHLMCTLARAASIPARAVAAYGPDVTPPDFHAVAQVWLAGEWHLVDATGMCAPDGLAVIAVGRDAYDIAFMEAHAPAELITQQVSVSRV